MCSFPCQETRKKHKLVIYEKWQKLLSYGMFFYQKKMKVNSGLINTYKKYSIWNRDTDKEVYLDSILLILLAYHSVIEFFGSCSGGLIRHSSEWREVEVVKANSTMCQCLVVLCLHAPRKKHKDHRDPLRFLGFFDCLFWHTILQF